MFRSICLVSLVLLNGVASAIPTQVPEKTVRLSSEEIIKHFAPESYGGYLVAGGCEAKPGMILCEYKDYHNYSWHRYELPLNESDRVRYESNDEGECFTISGPTANWMLKTLKVDSINECSVYDFWKNRTDKRRS